MPVRRCRKRLKAPILPLAFQPLLLVLAIASMAPGMPSAHATIVFSDDFSYANGPLAGNNGGVGWSAPWSGGTSQVANPLAGTGGQSVRLASDASVTNRTLSNAIATGTTPYYISFIFNANPFQNTPSGDYAGISLSGSGSGNLFLGMPGGSAELGFDWNVDGVGTEGGLYAAASNTNYLTLFEIKPGTNANTAVAMYATTDLLMTAADLITSGARASVENGNFTFDTVDVAGGYASGSISIAGLALATTANEAVAFTQVAVPEPGSFMTGAAAAALGGFGLWRRRRSATRTSSASR